jgi:hypothetical protein
VLWCGHIRKGPTRKPGGVKNDYIYWGNMPITCLFTGGEHPHPKWTNYNAAPLSSQNALRHARDREGERLL